MAQVLTNINGTVSQTSLDDARDISPSTEHSAKSRRLLWIHLDGREEADSDWIANTSGVPETVKTALMDSETRPRTEIVENGALVNLRGLGLTPDDDPDRLSSVRFWAQPGFVLSVSYRTSASIDMVRSQFSDGMIETPGDLLAAFARDMAKLLDPVVAAAGDTVDACESRIDAKRAHVIRRRVAAARSQAISYRRFVVPQVQALQTLAAENIPWIEDDDRLHLREATDKFARMAEELESIRERAALISEELTDLRAEQMDRRALLLSIVALVFLPITFLTGLLGMNVGGLPFQGEHGFLIVTAVCSLVGLALFGWFVHKHWLHDR